MSKQYTYNKEGHKVVEQETIHEPDELYLRRKYGNFWNDYYLDESKAWEDHLASLASYPVNGAVEWKDGENVTGKFELKETFVHCHGHQFNTCFYDKKNNKCERDCQISLYAYPLPQEGEEELWDEVLKIIGAYRPCFDNELKQLKQHFTIKRIQ